MKKIILICLISLISGNAYCQEDSSKRHTKIDILLEALSFYVNESDKEIDNLNNEYNMKINFYSKFEVIDSLLKEGIEPIYDKSLIPIFKKNYMEYRTGDRQKGIIGMKELSDKGFAPATLLYANTLKDDKEQIRYFLLGILQCCDICRVPIMEEKYNKHQDEYIPLPAKCYKNNIIPSKDK